MLAFQPLATRVPFLSSLFQDLIRRKGLEIALAGRDEDGLEPILNFLIR